MPYCLKCGKEVSEDASSCGACGYVLKVKEGNSDQESDPQQAERANKEWHRIIQQLATEKPMPALSWWSGLRWWAIISGALIAIVLQQLVSVISSSLLDNSVLANALLSVFVSFPSAVFGCAFAGYTAKVSSVKHGAFAGLWILVVNSIILFASIDFSGWSGGAFGILIITVVPIAIAFGMGFGALGGALGGWFLKQRTYSKVAVPDLIAALEHWNPNVRDMAARILERRGFSARDAAPALMDLLKNDEEYMVVCCSAARALGEIGDKTALPVLIEIMEDDGIEDDLRREAARAIRMIKGEG